MATTHDIQPPAVVEDEKATGHKPSLLRRVLLNPQAEASVTVVGFAVLFAGYGIWLGSLFFNVDARLLDVHQNAPILLLGLAVVVTLIAGAFDLSVAGMATLTTFLAVGLEVKSGLPFGLVIVICLAVGAVGGLINGFLVEKVGVNTFIATLGTGGVFLGISNIYSSGTDIAPGATGHQLPTWFNNFGSFSSKAPAVLLWIAVAAAVVIAYRALPKPKRIADGRWIAWRLGIIAVVMLLLVIVAKLPKIINNSSWQVVTVIVAGFVLWIVLEFTSYGRYLRASGSNRTAATLAGVRVQREVMKAFVLGGVLAALAGICLAASQGTAAPDVAGTFLLPAFAAAFLSTVVFSRGRFAVWGTIIGGMFVVWVSQGLIVGGLSPNWTDLVNGVVLITAVALSSLLRRQRS
jgi:ribose/xylose/arabinose/galactoside ABC-type transport system permease subunit